jgi:PKD repeat protein
MGVHTCVLASCRRFFAFAGLIGLLAVLLVLLPSAVQAAAGDVGYQGQSFSGTGTPTGIKRAESVLWWNDGSWWANMWDTVSQDFHIFRLNVSTQTWQDTGVTVDTRANTHADVLWDGARLYVASHRFVSDEQAAVSGDPSYLFRFSYDPTTKTYSRDSGFPVQINNMRTETLVIDKDSTGKLWATWQQGNQIYLNRTINGDDRQWGTPFALPNSAGNVTVDDNSALIAFGGNKIGVMWSNQSSSNYAMWFAVHQDGASDTSWSAGEKALEGSNSADDHMNLKSLHTDGSGRVFAATKTSNTSSSSALIMLSVRSSTGVWSRHPVAQVSDCPNRPMVILDEQNNVIHTFYTAPGPPNYECKTSGGAIYTKTSPLNSVSFPTGRGTPVIVDADSPFIHDASSTKQNVNGTTGIAVLAINGSTGRYWHHYQALSSSPPPPADEPPVANFSGSPTTGETPLTVNFTDTSTGSPTSWAWAFGNGSTSTAQHPSHVYTVAGTYSVTLSVTNSLGNDTITKTDYITVTPPPPDFNISVSPAKQVIGRGGSTSYTVSLTPSNGFTGQVTLSVTGQPSGTTTSFSPNPVNASTPASSTLSVGTSSTTKQGKYTLTITATSGTITHTATVALQIKR